MSDTVISKGFVAVLLNPITDRQAREDKSEELFEKDSNLHLNIEGTLVYSDVVPRKMRQEFYGLNLGAKMSAADLSQFVGSIEGYDLAIDLDTITPYSEIWYTGSDSGIAQLTLEEFKAKVS